MDENTRENTPETPEEIECKKKTLMEKRLAAEKAGRKASESFEIILPALISLVNEPGNLKHFPIEALSKNFQDALLARTQWYQVNAEFCDLMVKSLQKEHARDALENVESILLRAIGSAQKAMMESQFEDLNLITVLTILLMGAYRQLIAVSTSGREIKKLKATSKANAKVFKEIARVMKEHSKKAQGETGKAVVDVNAVYQDLVKRGVIS